MNLALDYSLWWRGFDAVRAIGKLSDREFLMTYKQREQEVERASNSWVAAGFILGLFAWLIALATDKGDGRANKALSGCLMWVVILVVLFVMVISGG